MCTCHSHYILALREVAEHLRTLDNLEALLAEPEQLAMVGRNCGSIDYDCRALVAERSGDSLDRVLVMDLGTLLLNCGSQGCGRAVVACHALALVHKVAGQRTHSDTTDSDKIYVLNLHIIL